MGLNEADRPMTVEEGARYAERMADLYERYTKGDGGMITLGNRLRELARELREGKL